MKNLLIKTRNGFIKFGYKTFLKPIFFKLDPEDVHDHMTKIGKALGRFGIGRSITKAMFYYSDPSLGQYIHGINFANPVGLAAGFDKNAELTRILPEVGFGFEEVGSITGEHCAGNPKPRLWRLKKTQGLVVYYGLKNDGCEKISARLADQIKKHPFKFPVGISIAKTNNEQTCETEAGIKDYVKAFKHFTHIGDYITINISCPNAFGGEPFTEPHKLEALLAETDKIPYNKPIFLKISPDLNKEQLDQILHIISKHKVDGLLCANLTKNRENAKIHKEDKMPAVGGISGKAQGELSNEQIRYVYKKWKKMMSDGTNSHKRDLTIIGCGGIFTAEDAYKKIKAGASLLQMITGMIFEGPQAISSINMGLVKLLKKDGYKNISEAVGKEHDLKD
ncbi:MAG: quinone-dependent dihydroorotate dehydrogenase [Candidatus Gracilibacteria bacterium]|jgi:dihydroorotate dehydrogenase